MLNFTAGDLVKDNTIILNQAGILTQVCTPSKIEAGKLHLIDLAFGDYQGIKDNLKSEGYQVITIDEWRSNKAKYI